MNEPIIECRGLEKTFSSDAEELTIFKDLDLEVQAGDSVAITGPSGSGKSTLLSIIGGLDKPSSGSVRVGAFRLSAIPERRLSEFRSIHVGFVFQFHYLLKDFDALENVALPAYMRGLPRKEAFKRAETLLAEVGLSERLRHLPSQLSGGERQRAAIARALINEPEVILADEPTGNLDAAHALSVRDILFDIVGRRGATIVLVTHDEALASAASVHHVLKDGRLERA